MAICYFHASNLMHIQILYSFNIPYTTTLTQRPVENVYSVCSSISLPASPVHHIITASVLFLLLFSFHSFLFSKVAITSSHCSPLFCRPIPQKKRLKTVMCVYAFI